MWTGLARVALIVLAFACAVYAQFGRYQVGLDFEGGASVTIGDALGTGFADPEHRFERIADAQRWRTTSYGHQLLFDKRDAGEHETELLVQALAAAGAGVSSRYVIEPAHTSWLGRPLLALVALAAAVGWAVAWRRRSRTVATAAMGLLAWAFSIVCETVLGGTYTVATWFAGAMWIVPLAVITYRAGRLPPTPLDRRFVAAWPGGALFAAAYIISLVVAATRTPSMDFWHVIKVGVAFASHTAPAIAILALVAVLAAPNRDA